MNRTAVETPDRCGNGQIDDVDDRASRAPGCDPRCHDQRIQERNGRTAIDNRHRNAMPLATSRTRPADKGEPDPDEYEVGQFRAAGGFLSKVFDVQSQRFSTVTCSRCSYTEIYKTDTSMLGNVFDFFTN